MSRPDPAVSSFWSRVLLDDDAACWEWTGGKAETGYGLTRSGSTSIRAHRRAYERLVGPVPGGLELDHLCRNRGCVNPAHLEPVTHAENMRRAARFYDRCAQGHPLTPEHGRPRPSGEWRCNTCRRERRAQGLNA